MILSNMVEGCMKLEVQAVTSNYNNNYRIFISNRDPVV